MDVISDARPSRLAKVEAHVEAAGLVNLTQSKFGPLRKHHQLIGGVCWNGGERGEVLIRHNHHVTGRVGKRIQAHKAVQTAMDDVGGLLGGISPHAMGDGVVDSSDHVAEDAMLVLGIGRRPGVEGGGNARACQRVCVGDVTVAPRGPEAIHSPSIAGLLEGCGSRSRESKFISFATASAGSPPASKSHTIHRNSICRMTS